MTELYENQYSWDGESYCIKGCGNPAVASVPYAMIDEIPVMELVCINHMEDEFFDA